MGQEVSLNGQRFTVVVLRLTTAQNGASIGRYIFLSPTHFRYEPHTINIKAKVIRSRPRWRCSQRILQDTAALIRCML